MRLRWCSMLRKPVSTQERVALLKGSGDSAGEIFIVRSGAFRTGVLIVDIQISSGASPHAGRGGAKQQRTHGFPGHRHW